jgi:hypothetical protein
MVYNKISIYKFFSTGIRDTKIRELFKIAMENDQLTGMNLTGMTNFTITGLPCRTPGFHLGMLSTALMASLSSIG